MEAVTFMTHSQAKTYAFAQPESKLFGVRVFRLASGVYDWGHLSTPLPEGAVREGQWEWDAYREEWRLVR